MPLPPLPGRLRALLGAAALLVAPGCDGASDCPGGLGCPLPPTAPPDVVEGVPLDSLFAPFTGEERQAVRAAWARPTPPDSAIVLRDVATLDRGQREVVRVVEGLAPDGSGRRFVGALRLPPRVAGDTRQRPLLLVLGDTPDSDLDDLLRTLPVRDDLRDEFAVLTLAYRGGTLTVGDRSFASSSAPDPYAGDADDALALVYGLRQLGAPAEVNLDRWASIGHGRGGAVALLATAQAAARGHQRPAYVLALAAPASFVLPSVQSAARRYLRGGSVGDLPALREVLAATAGRVRDGRLSVADARLALLRRSASALVEPPPFLFAAYGAADVAVPLEQARALDFLTSRTDALYLELENANHSTIRRDPQVLSTGAALLCEFVLADSVNECR